MPTDLRFPCVRGWTQGKAGAAHRVAFPGPGRDALAGGQVKSPSPRDPGWCNQTREAVQWRW